MVASFDPSFKAAANAPKASDDGFTFSFNDAPMGRCAWKMFAKKAGLTLDIHDTPPGTFTYFDAKKYTPTQAADVINRYLADRGYILIRRDNALVSCNLENPISPNLIDNVTVAQLPGVASTALASGVAADRGERIEQVAKDIEAVKGPQGDVKAMVSTNTIVVTDLGTNLRRIAEMVKDIVPPSDNGLIFHSYHLNYIAAEDAPESGDPHAAGRGPDGHEREARRRAAAAIAAGASAAAFRRLAASATVVAVAAVRVRRLHEQPRPRRPGPRCRRKPG